MLLLKIQSCVEITPQCKGTYKLEAIVLEAHWNYLLIFNFRKICEIPEK